MKKRPDSAYRRTNNRLAVLDALSRMKTTSRSELARELRLSKPSIADHLEPLITAGVAVELDEKRVAGRKPRLIRFNHRYRYVVAIDLHYDDPLFALGDLGGKTIDEFSIKINRETPFEARIQSILHGINMLLNANNVPPDSLGSVAISAPGVYTNGKQFAFANKQHTQWNMEELFQIIKQNCNDVDVFFSNDANAAAVGEHSGCAAEIDNLVYVRCGQGAGAGIVLDGKLFPGIGNAAGEIFNQVDPQKLENNSNLEKAVSIQWLIERIRADTERYDASFYAKVPPPQLAFKHVAEAYRHQDPLTLDVLQTIGTELGCVIANIANLLTIQQVVMGGEYDIFAGTLLPAISAVTDAYCMHKPQIIASRYGRRAGVEGLLIMARHTIFLSIANGENHE